MKSSQQLVLNHVEDTPDSKGIEPNLILIFGGSKAMKNSTFIAQVHQMFPSAIIAGCSTAGEILNESVHDESLALTYVDFETTTLVAEWITIDDASESEAVGQKLISKFNPEGLKHVFVLSDGLHVNGTQLVKGMRIALPEGAAVTGGLAGDGADFNNTYILNSKGEPQQKAIAAIGFYNPNLKVGYGSLGGWDTFGLERLVTKSKDNVLYEIDNQPALDLYKSFLGDQADGLPASGLLFPLSMRLNDTESPLVRTILAVDEETKSLTFAGDIPEGSYVKLMKANVDRLINGAEGAAKVSSEENNNPQLALLISCVGRKLVLKQMVEEEVEAVRDVVGENAAITGFYSYGEIAPFLQNAKCELHNQTMTITTFSE